MTDEDFLQAIADVDDARTRVAYAAWLEERGERDKAASLRMDLALAQAGQRDEGPISELYDLELRISPRWTCRAAFLYHVVKE